MDRWQMNIVRDDIAQAMIADLPDRAPSSGEVEFAVDLVALTANNITYAALGQKTPLLGQDAGYWDFFSERDEPGHLPVWGFATVTRSAAEGVAEGERFYGYWPLASHAMLAVGHIRDSGFTEASARRAALPAPYNQYTRLTRLPDHRDEVLSQAGVAHSQLGNADDIDARVDLVPASLAKGLEFDHVVLVEPADIADSESDRMTGLRRLYVCLTRAVTSLIVVHAKPIPVP